MATIDWAALPWYRKARWDIITLLLIIPFCGMLSLLWIPFKWKTTFPFALLYGYHTGLCITTGYHRLWAHRSYSASTPLKLYLAIFGAAAMEGPIQWWAREHRAHHRYTDTEEDPYNVTKGFFHAHILWMILKQPKRDRYIDISDLERDPIVAWQFRFFKPLAVFMSWGLPALVAGVCWNDWLGGLVVAGISRTFFVQQMTFCVNSVAHYFGDQPYDDRLTPRDSALVAILTMGEGYHNFHHEFPSDYRNGMLLHHIDPSKWLIYLWEKLGLAHNLKRFRKEEVEKANVQQLQKKLKERVSSYYWGRPLDELPVISWNEYQTQVKNGKRLICIEAVIHDIEDFIDEHPGGKKLLESYIGKDGTAVFNGGVYNHSKVARNVLSVSRIAVVRGGGEVEALK